MLGPNHQSRPKPLRVAIFQSGVHICPYLTFAKNVDRGLPARIVRGINR